MWIASKMFLIVVPILVLLTLAVVTVRNVFLLLFPQELDSEFFLRLLLTYVLAYLLACLLAYLFTYLLTCLLAYLLTVEVEASHICATANGQNWIVEQLEVSNSDSRTSHWSLTRTSAFSSSMGIKPRCTLWPSAARQQLCLLWGYSHLELCERDWEAAGES